jgi:hypothetical protein
MNEDKKTYDSTRHPDMWKYFASNMFPPEPVVEGVCDGIVDGTCREWTFGETLNHSISWKKP